LADSSRRAKNPFGAQAFRHLKFVPSKRASFSHNLLLMHRDGSTSVVLILLVMAAMAAALSARAQDAPPPTPQAMATVAHEAVIEGGHAVVRTPADIERDRDIVPQGNEPVEVPNRSTVSSEQYLKSKQGSAESTPGSEKSPARK
jgi:hypothetical protein